MEGNMLCGWCQVMAVWIYENIWKWAWTWISKTWRECSLQRCRWWCLCCNKWLCWVAMIILTIFAAILFIIAIIIGFVLCILCYILCLLMCFLPSLFNDQQCLPGCT